ncbi:hypothetical protein [Amaricoccus tamworthensis]|uniref:hypothetical protein n=1 Tax=Amaricoccus tamworthensis TaxID=57002 RepID=UPI003C7B0ED9
MQKHRGFPSKMPGTDYGFTIRRESKGGATELKARERYRDRRPADRRADLAFVTALVDYFGEEPFERGNLDAGRLNWLLNREVVPVDADAFDPADYGAVLRLDMDEVRRNFPEALED